MGFFIPTFHWFAFLSYAFDATVCVMLIDFINRTLDILLINIDREKQAKQHQYLLAKELHHRIQNLFTVIQAVIRFSLPGEGMVRESAVKQRLMDRLQSMSATNRAITDSMGDGVRLNDLISSEIRGFESQFEISGNPRLVLASAPSEERRSSGVMRGACSRLTRPFAGGKLTTWEGGMRAPLVVRWPGVIRPGTIKNEMFSALDWVPTFVELAGGPKGDGLKKQIEAGQYPGIVKTTLDGINQVDYLTGRSETSAREVFFYYSNKTPSAVRYKNWKMYFGMVAQDPTGAFKGVIPYGWTMVVNIKRDPFETSIGEHTKTFEGMGGALGGPVTAYTYDWNVLPLGQQLWLKELETYVKYPPLQNPAAYNLDQVMQQIREMKTASHAGE